MSNLRQETQYSRLLRLRRCCALLDGLENVHIDISGTGYDLTWSRYKKFCEDESAVLRSLHRIFYIVHDVDIKGWD